MVELKRKSEPIPTEDLSFAAPAANTLSRYEAATAILTSVRNQMNRLVMKD